MTAIVHADQSGLTAEPDPVTDTDRWSVVWTRGEGCRVLAETLAAGDAVFGGRDPHGVCIEARADVIVQRRLSSFDLVNVVVPRRFRPDRFGSVVTVAGGSHSELAARVARLIGVVNDREVHLVGVSRSRADDGSVQGTLDDMCRLVSGLTPVMVRSDSASSLLETLDSDALLVMGAPGGSWWQRQMYGPRHQLKHTPSGGVVIVRSTPVRCFRWARTGSVLSPWLHVEDAVALVDEEVAPVVDGGYLVGIVRRHALQEAPDHAEVQTVAEEPVSVTMDEPVAAAGELRAFLDGAPVPVVDHAGRYRGSLPRLAA